MSNLETRIKKILKEVNSTNLNDQEVKAVLQFINALSAGSGLRYQINDKTILGIERQISDLRVEMMRYVEDNSNYTFYGKSPNGWKLIKKGK